MWLDGEMLGLSFYGPFTVNRHLVNTGVIRYRPHAPSRPCPFLTFVRIAVRQDLQDPPRAV
jgi:hypothetical protein